MIFKLYNHYVELYLAKDEPVDLLTDLSGYLSFNDTVHRYEKLRIARGQDKEVDFADPEQLEEMAYMTDSPYYQNFLCYTLNLINDKPRTTYNFIRDKDFLKNEMSDGYVSVLRPDLVRKKVRFNPGLLRIIILYLQDQVEEYGIDFDFQIEEKRENRLHLSPEPVYEWNGISLRPEQRKVVDKIRKTLSDDDQYGYLFSRIMLELSVNFGKTFTLYVISKNFTLEDGSPAPVIWFFSDRELLSKAVDDYIELEPDLTVWASDQSYTGKYLRVRGKDQRPTYDQPGEFTLAMVQTLDARFKRKKLSVKDTRRYHIGVYDECHKAGGDRVKNVLFRFRFACLIGGSGSPTSSMSGANRYAVTGHFGAIRHQIEFKDTVELGRSLPLQVWSLHNKIDVDKPTNSYNVSKIKRQGIYYSDQRYQLIRAALEWSLNDERQVLIYGGSIQLKYLEYWYKRLVEDGFDLDFTFGDDPERVEKIAAFARREKEVLFSNRIVGTGVDISTIGAVIFLPRTDNEIEVKQAPIGRLGRLFKTEGGKPFGIIFDLFDDDSFREGSEFVIAGMEEPKVYPGELTRTSEIRQHYYKVQDIPIIEKTLEDLAI